MSIEDYIPTFAVEAVYDLRPDALRQHGIKAVLVDLDNTLIAWNNPEGTPELRSWLDEMTEAGLPVVVVSNNTHDRVAHAVETFGVDFVARAMKPFTRGINLAIESYGFDRDEVVMVGDQLMTDIRAAHRAGIRSILVKPLVKSDALVTKFNRWREARMLKKIQATYGPIVYQKGLSDEL